MDHPALAAIIASGVGLIASVILDWWRRRNDYASRWDEQRLDAFSGYLTAVGGTLKSGDVARALQFRLQSANLYERLLLLGSDEVIATADSARRAALKYVRALEAGCSGSGDSPHMAFTDEGEALLSSDAYEAQQEGFSALQLFVAAARRQLRAGEARSRDAAADGAAR